MDAKTYFIQCALKRYFRRFCIFLLLLFCIDQLASCSAMIRTPYVSIKRPFYQMIFASGKEHAPLTQLEYRSIPVQDPNPYGIIKIGGYEISKTFVRKFQGLGRIGYLDENNALIKGWYLSSGNKEVSKIYKNVVPYDILILYGKTAEPNNFKQLKFDHEENAGFVIPKTRQAKWDTREISNIHVLPANERIKKIVSVLKYNDVVYLEGFLVDWDEKSVPRDQQYFKTARETGERSQQLIGGRSSGLCQQLYLTKVILNGYVYH